MIGYIFLGQVIVMVMLVIWLSFETQKDDYQTRRAKEIGCHIDRYPVSKELCVYITFSFFFALSYIGRFINNEFFFSCDKVYSDYNQELVQLTCYLLEGASFGALMGSHMHYHPYKSKRKDRPAITIEDEPEPTITGLTRISVDDDDQAIDSQRLASSHHDAREGSEQARIR